jgi:hypothetical protein
MKVNSIFKRKIYVTLTQNLNKKLEFQSMTAQTTLKFQTRNQDSKVQVLYANIPWANFGARKMSRDGVMCDVI